MAHVANAFPPSEFRDWLRDIKQAGRFENDAEVAEHVGIRITSFSKMKYDGACIATRVKCMRALAAIKRSASGISPEVGGDGKHQQVSHLLDLLALIPQHDRMIGRAVSAEERAVFLRRRRGLNSDR